MKIVNEKHLLKIDGISQISNSTVERINPKVVEMLI